MDILNGDLKELSRFNEDTYKQLTELVTLSDFRYNFSIFTVSMDDYWLLVLKML